MAASGAVSTTTVSILHEINTCTKNAGASLEDTEDTPTGSHALTGVLADTTSVFMPQMRAQHVAFAGLAVWLKLSVFTSSALALRTAVQAVYVRFCITR